MVILQNKGNGTYLEVVTVPMWIITDYTESDQPCEPDCSCDFDDINSGHIEPYNCGECDKPIYGRHFVCMDDGSDNRHIDCVTVI